MKKELFLLLFFTNFLTASIQELGENIKNYGPVEFITGIGGPAFVSILSACLALEDLSFKMPEYCAEGQMVCARFGVHCSIKGCEGPKEIFTYLKFGLSTFSGLYGLYNIWHFYKNKREQR